MGPAVYSKADVDIETHTYQMDPLIEEFVDLISAIYMSTPIKSVAVNPVGGITLSVGTIAEDVLKGLRTKLRVHVSNNYPALSAKHSTSVSKGPSAWTEPSEQEPENGIYLVMTANDYCRKAIYYEKDSKWEYADTGEEVKVLLYMRLPDAAPGYDYGNY